MGRTTRGDDDFDADADLPPMPADVRELRDNLKPPRMCHKCHRVVALCRVYGEPALSDDAVVCPQCRAELVASARAALVVLADDNAITVDRHVATDVLIEVAETLRLPTNEGSAE